MNKGELINAVQRNLTSNMKSGVEATKADAERAVNAVLDELQEGTANGGVQLIGFGTFSVKERKARKGRNPQTGKEIDIPASKVISFKPGKAFKDKLTPPSANNAPKKKGKKKK